MRQGVRRPLGFGMTREELIGRLKQDEDALVERKTKPDRSGVTETIAAFANSVEPGQEAVLFLGVRPDKTVVGVEAPDPAGHADDIGHRGAPRKHLRSAPAASVCQKGPLVRGGPGHTRGILGHASRGVAFDPWR